MIQIVTIHNGILPRILRRERNAPTGPRGEELRDNREDMFIWVRRELVILIRPTVAFRREEFDVGLFGGEEVHWVAFFVSGSCSVILLLVLLPEGFVGEAIV